MASLPCQHPSMGKVTRTSKRKADHIRVNLEEDVQSGLHTGLERLHFEHNAVPELSLAEIDTRLEFLGRRLQVPLLISSMTGGTPRARGSTRLWPRQRRRPGSPWDFGSQRAALEDQALADTYQVRRYRARHPALRQPGRGAVQLRILGGSVPPGRGDGGGRCAGAALQLAAGGAAAGGGCGLQRAAPEDSAGVRAAAGPGDCQGGRLGDLGGGCRAPVGGRGAGHRCGRGRRDLLVSGRNASPGRSGPSANGCRLSELGHSDGRGGRPAAPVLSRPPADRRPAACAMESIWPSALPWAQTWVVWPGPS